MSPLPYPLIILPGANGRTPDLAAFSADPDDSTHFEPIGYPGWRRYVANDFSAGVLIADLAAQIATKVPQAPICIVGISIGGHFAYAAALHLQASGRKIAGFCAIDTFMVASSAPSAGWQGRALALALELLRKRPINELTTFVRSRAWRALFKLAGGRLPAVLRAFFPWGRLPAIFRSDRMFEEELSMRLLIRHTAPWIGSLDLKPVPLNAPAILLRTTETASDDPAWRRRCPAIEVIEIPGKHHTIFEPENINALRESFIAATRVWEVPAADTGGIDSKAKAAGVFD